MSREFDELLSAYLDGEVSPEERAAVERQLEQSPQLRETLDELSEVGDLIRRLPKPRAPIDLPERVVAAIATKPLASTAAPRKRHRLFGAWPILAAGTVLAAGVAIVVVMPRGPKNVDNLASNSPRSGGAPALAASPSMRGVDSDHDGMSLTDLSVDGADRRLNFDVASASRSLTRSMNTLGRAPRQGDVMRILQDNAGQTSVLVFNVVDTRQIENKVRTILINNSMNVVETETPLPQATAATAGNAGELVYYVEGPPQQVEQALEDIEAFAVPGGVFDLGPLASDPEPAARRGFNFAEDEAKPTSEASPTLQKDKMEDRPATTPSPTAAPAPRYSVPLAASDFSQTPPAAAPAAASAARGGAEPARTKAQLGDELLVKAGEAAKGLEQVPPKPGPEKPEVEKLAAPAPAQVTNGYLGFSAQIDSNAAILEPLRNRAAGNLQQGNAVQGNAVQGNQLQRNSFGQNQNFFKFRNQKSAEESQDRKLNEAIRGRQEELSESKAAGPKQQQQLPQQLQRQPGLAGRAVADGTRNLDAATVANPQNVPSPEEDLVRALIILKPEPPKPAAPVPAESAPKKAGD